MNNNAFFAVLVKWCKLHRKQKLGICKEMQMQAAIYFFSPSCNKYFKNKYLRVSESVGSKFHFLKVAFCWIQRKMNWKHYNLYINVSLNVSEIRRVYTSVEMWWSADYYGQTLDRAYSWEVSFLLSISHFQSAFKRKISQKLGLLLNSV